MSRTLFVLGIVSSLLVVGCAATQMTAFRKHGATMDDERRDWGLCGGDFYPNGRLRTPPDQKLLACMKAKGYVTLNDYYVEQQISFVNTRQPDKIFISSEDLQICRFSQLEQGLCSRGFHFVTKADLAATIKCMSSRGFEPTIPDQGTAFRIVEDVRTLSPNFCLSLTPRNGKGGLTFNGQRWE